jgi:16S rRNA (guanine966-N2)-methyltransferase
VFNILAHGIHGLELAGARVLDLFAGTGALGFEALSRGAKFCQFIDDDATARGVIHNNADALGATGLCKIWRRDATSLGPCAPQTPYDLVFVDPPYGKGLGELALASLTEGQWLKHGAIVMLEESENTQVSPAIGLDLIDQRNYGNKILPKATGLISASSPVLQPLSDERQVWHQTALSSHRR